MKTIDQVSSETVVITINNYTYYVTKYILQKYFKNHGVDRNEFINVDRYTMSFENFEGAEISASKKLCDIIVLEMYESFPGTYIKNILTTSPGVWPFYFGFIHKYLNVPKNILDNLIKQNIMITIYYDALYNCAYKGSYPETENLYNTIAGAYVQSLKKCGKICSRILWRCFIERAIASATLPLQNNKIGLRLCRDDPTFIMTQVILTQNKINVLRDFFDSLRVTRDHLMYLGIDLKAYDSLEPEYGI